MLETPHYLSGLLFFSLSLLFVFPYADSDELPEGINVTVIAEYKSRVPTLDKVRLVRVLLEPGASFDDIVIKNEEYCVLKKGILTHVNHTTEITDLFTVGSRWAPPKGDRHTVTNNGDEVAEMWVYQLIEKGEDGGKM